ncbi:LysR family transcriptional regulator [Desulfovibrio sp. JC022]|uniref:LysR family transcriptional regulator n=1 Tax=Desulfovibrio sp. JC022 TaxID=2593642 RepID=UPI0013D6BB48|nr:LysR family transcriptional regulator [Desulfovibrio sp. JC022]NDV24148.1 LysR family transcriptional regulator [Desulfovibrio sp. JC022]
MLDITKTAQLTPDLLRSFLVAADTGSFTRTASLVHRTQAAVSMQMKKLEEDLKCVLFKRDGRGVSLTAEGEILYRYSTKILDLHDEALSAVSGPKLHGSVRLGAPDDYAMKHLPGIMQEFAVNHPQVQVDVFCDDTPTLAGMLDNGKLDLVIATDHAQTEYSTPLELSWILPERMDPSEMEELPLALFHPVCCYRENGLKALEKAGRKYRIAYGSPSLAGLLAAVRGGLAIAVVTKDTTAKGCRHVLPSDGLPPIKSVYIDLRFQPGNRSEVVSVFGGFIAKGLGIVI